MTTDPRVAALSNYLIYLLEQDAPAAVPPGPADTAPETSAVTHAGQHPARRGAGLPEPSSPSTYPLEVAR